MSCLRVRSVCLLYDETSFLHEWNRHKQQWDYKDHIEVRSVLSDVMKNFFAQSPAGVLRALVLVDDQLLNFQWVDEDNCWAVMDIEDHRVYLEARFMWLVIAMSIDTSWAVLY